jgi:hypothetical protein
MRIPASILLALIAACGDGSDDLPNVHIAVITGEPEFFAIRNVRRGAAGRWQGHIDDVGAVRVSSIPGTMQVLGPGADAQVLEGLEPGDEIEIAADERHPLPADCTCDETSAPAVGSITQYLDCQLQACPSPKEGIDTLVVYREASTSVPGSGESLVRCRVTTWDELRPTFAGSVCP